MNCVEELLKMTKPKLKEMHIQKLNEIETILKLINEQGVPGADALVINSNYLENRSYKDPNDFGHKIMKKENYAVDIKRFQTLIDALKKIKQEYEIGNQKQDGKGSLEKSNPIQKEIDRSNPIQNDVVKLEKGNSIQTTNEKSNQNQRGGKRIGAGRKGLGVTKKVSLTLSEEAWSEIEKLIEDGSNQSKVLRSLIEKGLQS